MEPLRGGVAAMFPAVEPGADVPEAPPDAGRERPRAFGRRLEFGKGREAESPPHRVLRGAGELSVQLPRVLAGEQLPLTSTPTVGET